MRDDLRAQGLIPLNEPYTSLSNFQHKGSGGKEITTSQMLSVSGSNAIVDWVFVEVRDKYKGKGLHRYGAILATIKRHELGYTHVIAAVEEHEFFSFAVMYARLDLGICVPEYYLYRLSL